MPAAAVRNRHHQDHTSNAQTTLPRPPSMPAQGTRRTARGRIETSPEPDWQSVEPLLDHFNKESEQARAARTAQRKAKRAHRPLQLSWPAGIAATLLLGHLMALLWLYGSALAVRNRDAELNKQIWHARGDIQRTQKKIAARASAAQIDQWAREEGWHKATIEFDDVTKPAAVRFDMPPADENAPSKNDAKITNDAAATARVEIEVQGEGEIR